MASIYDRINRGEGYGPPGRTNSLARYALTGGLASVAAAGAMFVPFRGTNLGSFLLRNIADRSLAYAAKQAGLARRRGAFFITQTVQQLSDPYAGGFVEDISQVLFRNNLVMSAAQIGYSRFGIERVRRNLVEAIVSGMTDKIPALKNQYLMLGRKHQEFVDLTKQLVGTQHRLTDLMGLTARGADPVRDLLFQSDYRFFIEGIERLFGDESRDVITEFSRAIHVARHSAVEAAKASMRGSLIEKRVAEIAQRHIQQGVGVSGPWWMEKILEAGGYRPVSMLEAIEAGLHITGPAQAESVVSGFRAGHRIFNLTSPLGPVTVTEETLMQEARAAALAGDAVREAYMQAHGETIRQLYRHLKVFLGSDVTPVSIGSSEVVGFKLSPAGIEKLAGARAGQMYIGPDGNLVDMSFVFPAFDRIKAQFTSIFNIPLSPLISGMNPFRVFPWYRPSDVWFHRIPPTAKQVGLSALQGIRPQDPLGTPHYVFGNEIYQIDLGELLDTGRVKRIMELVLQGKSVAEAKNIVLSEISELRGHRVTEANMRPEAVLRRVGDVGWTVLNVRGETMRSIVEALTGTARARDRSLLGRLLDIGGQTDTSFWTKVGWQIRAETGRRHPTDPVEVLQTMYRGEFGQWNEEQLAQLRSNAERMLQYVIDTAQIDELEVARQYLGYLEDIGNMVGVDGDERMLFMKTWIETFRQISSMNDIDEFFDAMRNVSMHKQMGETMVGDYISTILRGDVTQLLKYGYTIENPVVSDYIRFQPLSRQMRDIMQHASYLYTWASEHRGPVTPESLFSQVPEAIFGMPDAKRNAARILRAMMIESQMVITSRLADILGDSEPAVSAAAWALRDAMLTAPGYVPGPDDLGWAVASTLLESFTGATGEDLRDMFVSLGQMGPGGPLGFLEKNILKYRKWHHVWEPLSELGKEPGFGTRILLARNFSEIEDTGKRLWEYTRATTKFFFTGDPASMTPAGLQSYFFALRLNEMISPYGLGLSPEALRSPFSIYANLFARRILPVYLGMEAWKYGNSIFDNTGEGVSPAELLTDAAKTAQIGLTKLMDFTGITGLKKMLVNNIPGLDQYFTPRSAEELQWYHDYGFSTVRRGRWWFVVSRSPLAGYGVEAYVPPYSRAVAANWQAASNVETSGLAYFMRGDSPLPTFHNPIAPFINLVRRAFRIKEQEWMERHRYDRPYPGITPPDPPPYTDQVLSGMDIAAADMSGGALYRGRVPYRVAGPGGSEAPPDPFRLLMYLLGRTTAADRVEEAVMEGAWVGPGFVRGKRKPWPVRISEAVAAQEKAEQMGARGRGPGGRGPAAGGIGSGASVDPILAAAPGGPFSAAAGIASGYVGGDVMHRIGALENVARTFGEYKFELHGLYGWLTSEMLGLRSGTVALDDPGWALSFSRRFWETRLGGIDVIPWQSELNEFFRRWLHRRKASEIVLNPLPNTMPVWLPERFRRGDPYTRIPMGELRLPGEAYRRLNPMRFTERPLQIRASMLGATEDELIGYLLGLEEDVGDTDITRLGEKIHTEVQKYFRRLGVLIGEEVSIYDPKHHVSGHIDAIIRTLQGEQMVVEIKSIGMKKWKELPALGFEQHRAQLQQYMYTTGTPRGALLYINRDDPTQTRWLEQPLDMRFLEHHWQKAERVREFIMQKVRSGQLHEGYLYPDLVKFEILSDVAPLSAEWREVRRKIRQTESQLGENELRRFHEAEARAKKAGKRYELYPYRNVRLSEKTHGVLEGITSGGNLIVRTKEGVRTYRPAGIDWKQSGLRELGYRGDMPELVASYLRSQGLRIGGSVDLLASDRLGPISRWRTTSTPAVILNARGRSINLEALRQGVATKDETDTSPEATALQQKTAARIKNTVLDYLTHLDTPIHSKLLRVRTPLQEWERSFVFGTIASSWAHPFSSYIWPTLHSILLKNDPVTAFLKSGFFSMLFFRTKLTRQRAFLIGGAIGAAANLIGYATGAHGQPPRSVRKRWEIEQYSDLLEYIKYRRLYEYHKKMALKYEGFDMDRLLNSIARQEQFLKETRVALREEQAELSTQALLNAFVDNSSRKRVQREMERSMKDIQDEMETTDRLRRIRKRFARRRAELAASSIVRMYLPPHARAALVYRDYWQRTAFGTHEDSSIMRKLRAVRAAYREIYQGVIETGSKKERRRFFELIPEYHQRLFRDHLAPDVKEPIPQKHPLDLLAKYGLPGPGWLGWLPSVDTRLLLGPIMEQHGIDPVSAAIFPGQQVQGRLLGRMIGIPQSVENRRRVVNILKRLFGGVSDEPTTFLEHISMQSPRERVVLSVQAEDDTELEVLAQILEDYY